MDGPNLPQDVQYSSDSENLCNQVTIVIDKNNQIPALESLMERLAGETGPNSKLDEIIEEAFGDGPSDKKSALPYTSSVDACIALIHRLIPDAHWHVGFGPMGIEPYAFVSQGKERWDSSAPTVPLALLTSLIKARLADEGSKSGSISPSKQSDSRH